ncbi:MAG: GGDEF domain-containing protein [gamma proteobacterium endosymbiont of Lamellibrachia anaximandri]|nr:GGDEF domain-containing protein [gamma proteobacterium endosymbiont of Lamellibrachia anaximandri]MBL3617490.1 GGDEF domain-containing protein [gamma proteobacterium endosymbiont of Lamellibrachia anaximandri]
METNPYSGDNFIKASEHLRQAISLLSQHKIPPSPMNFRMGYDYVVGKDKELATAFNEIISQPEELSEENLWEMYRRLFIQDERALEKTRQELRHIIGNIQGEFERTGGNLPSYSKTLDHFADILTTSVSPEVMAVEVQKVLDNTRSVEQSQHQFESKMSNIMTEMELLRKEMEQIKEESLIDALTGISNRKAFDTTLEDTIQTAREEKTAFCLLLADIDHFKKFNDTYGHLVGDKVLRFVGLTLKRCLKGQDMAARYGGEEFAVILPQTALGGAIIAAEQIRKAVSSGELKDKRTNQGYGKVTISIGIAQFYMNGSPDELIQSADKALYLAKERGRNRVEKAA